ncbi:MAG TPA: hypothetical protein VG778_08570 [Blastocatellia bacterium]|nr:hypothetical protein [Blastocatellia bacterium]
MTIFGKSVGEYVAFAKPLLILIIVVGIIRLALSLGGAPTSVAWWFSMTAVAWAGVVYYAIRVHTSGFGSYKHLLPICILGGIATQIVVVPSIILAILTGTDNVFSVPEAFFGSDGKTWLHVAGHLVMGTTVGPTILWLLGCVVMFVTKKVVNKEEDKKAAASA